MENKVVKGSSQQSALSSSSFVTGKGTPKTISEAIANGEQAGDIEAHVRDFIKNKICVLTISPIEAESKAAFKLHELLLKEKAA